MKWSSPASLFEDTFLKHLGEPVPTLADVTMPADDTDELADWCVRNYAQRIYNQYSRRRME